MRPRHAAFVAVAAAGLLLFVWTALRAPVVVWSDSALDLRWARTSPLHPSGGAEEHTPKPGYILYLAGASRAFSNLGPARSAVLAQSLLLWLAFVAASARVLHRRGGSGLLLLVLLLSFLPLRDGASVVLSDTPAAALFLLLAAFSLEPPRGRAALAALGVGLTLLFWMRPNVGAVAIVVALILLRFARKGPAALGPVALACAATMVPAWLLTRPPPGADPMRGLGTPILMGSAPYYWMPALGETPPRDSRAAIRQTLDNCRRFLAGSPPDVQRELAWRMLHGVFGVGLYDARWSAWYARADSAARRAAPFVILGALFLLGATGARSPNEKLVAAALLAMLVVHDLVFGSHPRYVLPFLPALLLLCTAGEGEPVRRPVLRFAATAIVICTLALALERNRGILDQEWGVVESPGVSLVQEIPRGALPVAPPATLHVRLAPPLLPAPIGVDVYGPDGRLLLAGAPEWPRSAYLTVPLPAWL